MKRCSWEVGTTIRIKDPYWGEAAHKIVETKPGETKTIPSGSKHGIGYRKGDAYTGEVHWGALIPCEEAYEICPLYMRAWLGILGYASLVSRWLTGKNIAEWAEHFDTRTMAERMK